MLALHTVNPGLNSTWFQFLALNVVPKYHPEQRTNYKPWPQPVWQKPQLHPLSIQKRKIIQTSWFSGDSNAPLENFHCYKTVIQKQWHKKPRGELVLRICWQKFSAFQVLGKWNEVSSALLGTPCIPAGVTGWDRRGKEEAKAGFSLKFSRASGKHFSRTPSCICLSSD